MKKYLLFFTLFYISYFSNAQWKQTSLGGDIINLCVIGDTVFAGSTAGGVFNSTNNGANWTAANNGLTDLFNWALIANGENLFVGTYSGVFRSTDRANTWSLADTGLTDLHILSLAENEGNVFAGTTQGIYISNDSGKVWKTVGFNTLNISAFGKIGSKLFAATGTTAGINKIFFSRNNWTTSTSIKTPFPNQLFYGMIEDGSNLFAGTSGGIFLSSDSGNTWTNIGLLNTVVKALCMKGSTLIAGTEGGGVFFSPDTGISWTAIDSGLTDQNVETLAIVGNTLFAGTHGAGVFVAPLGNLLGVREISDNKINISIYPNPFNKQSTAKIDLLASASVQLVLYNSLGQEVSTIENKHLDAGTYNYNINVADKGIYFLRNTIDGIPSTQKLIQIE